jgi:hypothetical protein
LGGPKIGHRMERLVSHKFSWTTGDVDDRRYGEPMQ